MKYWWLLVLLIPVVHAASIADWPDFYVKDGRFRALYVVGEEAPSLDVVSATVISASLARFENVTTEVGTATIDSDVADITKHDAVVIGSPCENTAAFVLMDDPDPCYKDLAGSVGYIKLFENNGRTQLLITGLSAEDRHAAATFLAENDLSLIVNKEHIVQSGTNSTPQFFTRVNTTTNVSNVTANVTVNASNKTVVTAVAPAQVKEVIPKEVEYGEYEPLEELPEKKKSLWNQWWVWLLGVLAVIVTAIIMYVAFAGSE